MGAYKDFDQARAEAAREPLRFKLGGQLLTTRGILPAEPLLVLARDGDKEGVEAFGALAGFLDAVVVETDQLHEALKLVEWPDVVAVVNWIITEATARPFEEPSPSPESPPVNGEKSRLDWIPIPEEPRST